MEPKVAIFFVKLPLCFLMKAIFQYGVKSDMNEFSHAQLAARINFRSNNGIVSHSVQLNFVSNKALLI